MIEWYTRDGGTVGFRVISEQRSTAMTTNKPEVVGWMIYDGSIYKRYFEAEMVRRSSEQQEPLIRLSDYERLQAELESLKEYAELGKAVQQKREPGKRYGCHCDLEEGMEPDGCVIDEGSPHHCIFAKHISAKEQCEYWRVIASDANQEH